MGKLCKDGYIVKKSTMTHSRSKARVWAAAKRLGRHTGIGKRQGCKNARMPVKLFWIRRQRALRRLLKKLRKKKVLIESIHKERNEKLRQEKINQEQEQRRMKNLEKRRRKLESKVAKQKTAE